MSNQVYSYIGNADLNDSQHFKTERTSVGADGEYRATLQKQNKQAPAIFTFVVDTDGLLWIANRQSEHVACARGGDVLSAGEMTVEVENGQIIVSDVTNQSTGYCPEPESWLAVEAALDRAHIPHPGNFTQMFIFRLCENCGQINIVKDNEFICGVCSAKLEQEWNF